MSARGHPQAGVDAGPFSMSSEGEASTWSAWTFGWVGSLVRLGYRRPLQFQDLGELGAGDQPGPHLRAFQAAWTQQVDGAETCAPGQKSEHRVSMWRVIRVAFLRPLLCATAFAVAGDVLGFVPPLCLEFLVEYVEDAQAAGGAGWLRGYMLAAAVVVALVVQNLCWERHLHEVLRTGMHAQMGMMGMVYQKVLRLSNKSRGSASVGNIMNLYSGDALQLRKTVVRLSALVSAPLIITVSLGLLVRQLGSATFVGFVVLLVLTPLQIRMGRWLKRLQKTTLRQADKRLRVVNEIVQGVRVIKLHAWEQSFQARCQHHRAKEIKAIRFLKCAAAVCCRFVWRLYLDDMSMLCVGWVNRRYLVALYDSFIDSAIVLVALSTFLAYSWLHGDEDALTPSRAFTALALLHLMAFPINILVNTVNFLISCNVSLTRLRDFLLLDELQGYVVHEAAPFTVSMGSDGGGSDEGMRPQECVVSLEDAECCWEEGTKGASPPGGDPKPTPGAVPAFRLHNVNLAVQRGHLTVVCGPVAAGKSTLLSAMLGDTVLLSGRVRRCGSVAFCPQTPWILNATVQENVVFGNPWDARLFRTVLHVCALETDIKSLPAGVHTEIGARGVNLSGGQKARIALARAVYADRDVFLLDDVLSACDAHTSRWIFEKCIRRWMAGGCRSFCGHSLPAAAPKTVVLVTHHVAFASRADHVVVLDAGRVVAQGSWAHVTAAAASSGTDVQSMVSGGTDVGLLLDDDNNHDDDARHDREEATPRSVAEAPGDNHRNNSGVGGGGGHDTVQPHIGEEVRVQDVSLTACGGTQSNADQPQQQQQQQHVKQQQQQDLGGFETKVESQVTEVASTEDAPPPRSTSTSGTSDRGRATLVEREEREVGSVKSRVYLQYLLACGVAFGVGTLVLRLTVNGALVATDWSLSLWSTQSGGYSLMHYVSMYAALSGGAVLLTLFYNLCWATASTRAASVLHNRMLTRLLGAPTQFFDVTPSGRILNRFSGDTATIDTKLSVQVSHVLKHAAAIGAVIAVEAAVVPWVLPVFIPALAVYVVQQGYYRRTSREVQRLASISKSPMLNHLGETLGGVSSIRAFAVADAFAEENQLRVSHSFTTFWASSATNRWLGIRLNWIGSSIIFAATLFVVVTASSIDPGLAGLVLAYSVRITGHLMWLVRNFTATEAAMNSVERVVHYGSIAQEAPAVVPTVDASLQQRWPSVGRVLVRGLSARYRPGLPLVLGDVTLDIAGGEKVGVVGRSGSGKSTLALCLSRVVEAVSGSITIDDVDISSIGLRLLRQAIGVIPQDPTLFSGTVRYNLDPTSEHTDAELVEAVKLVCLTDMVFRDLPHGLDSNITEGGHNLSVGQRQLLCMGRALLHRTKVLVMDEATASMDQDTDSTLGEVLGRVFQACTVITIAHRLDTILHYDKVVVMDSGHVVEVGPPGDLLEKDGGAFAALWHHHTHGAVLDEQ